MAAEKSMAPVAPAPECNWTGFYIGVNAGIGQLDSDFTDRNDWYAYATQSYTETAFVGGGQLGYNYQWQDLVFGIEGDFSGSTADIKRHSDYGYPEDNVEYDCYYCNDDHAKIDFMMTLRGRLGVSFNNNRALLYATAGGAYAHGEWRVQNDYYGPVYEGSNYYLGDWRGDDWRWGWVGGFGFEYALNCHWSLRGEGLYYWFQEDTVGNTQRGSEYIPANGYYYNYTFGDTLWTYRVGLNYKFTGFFGAH
jgi:outer membrane immunogenic protein